MSDRATPAAGLASTDFRAAQRRNRRSTLALCGALILIGGSVGYLLGFAVEAYAGPPVPGAAAPLPWLSAWGAWGGGAMLAAGLVWVLIALWWGDRIVIAMAEAEEVSAADEPRLHNVVEEMAIAAGLPKPRVTVIETPALNAFATGLDPDRATVGVTRGLLDTLDREELQGVVAHEMGHIANDDIVYMTAVGVVVGLIVLVADMARRSLYMARFGLRGRGRKGGGALAVLMVVLLLVGLLAPLASRLVQMAISRQREYLADATSVQFTRNPHGLIRALEKIGASTVPQENANRAIQHLFIANPVRTFGADARALFATHPAVVQRVARLRDLGV